MSTALLVFARAPVPGAAKTRLIPALGARGAAQLHRQLVERTLDMACRAQLGPVTLCCAPDTGHPFFADCAAEHPIELQAQVGDDLGARMQHALATALTAARQAILIGTDCPPLAPHHLRQAARHLDAAHDVVLGPAEDGGYVLIGGRRVDGALFDGVLWGSDQVLATTRQRLQRLGWRWAELPPLPDLDRPEDLHRLAAYL